MKITATLGICLVSILNLTGCERASKTDALASNEASIVNGTPDEGHPSVVGVVTLYNNAGKWFWLSCTGTYIGPRSVLTAAHCIKPGYTRVFYGGIDLYTARLNLEKYFFQGTPLQENTWARAESIKVNPAFTKSTYFADIAVLSLDSELPIPETPVAKWRLESQDIGTLGTEVGYGATESDMMLTQTKGWGTKRVGQAPFLGSPPAGMDTDHPGIGLDYVRNSLAMFDGTEPYSNGCAGDSGGPILMNHGSKEYVYGVASWTGFYCQDYSFYTRIDPFVSFIDDAIARAGRGDVEPTLDCVRPLENGMKRAYFGFNSANDVTVDIPFGSENRLPGDKLEVRPTQFGPGEHHFAAAGDYAANENLLWKIQAPARKSVVLNGPASGPACDPNDVTTVAADACIAQTAAHCGYSMENCVTDWLWSYTPDFDPCAPLVLDYMKCSATVKPDQFYCFDVYPIDISDTCTESLNSLLTCWGY